MGAAFQSLSDCPLRQPIQHCLRQRPDRRPTFSTTGPRMRMHPRAPPAASNTIQTQFGCLECSSPEQGDSAVPSISATVRQRRFQSASQQDNRRWAQDRIELERPVAAARVAAHLPAVAVAAAARRPGRRTWPRRIRRRWRRPGRHDGPAGTGRKIQPDVQRAGTEPVQQRQLRQRRSAPWDRATSDHSTSHANGPSLRARGPGLHLDASRIFFQAVFAF